ncbi:hypothetical protein TcG_01197 [Trypanosoma cruzi]|nr:hypothetical protein TcG_01197 [Trypanosoma cruzi]
MNFRTLTRFWRKGGKKGAGDGAHGNSSSVHSVSSQQQQQQQQQQEQRAIGPFENKQAALHYIFQILESFERNGLALSPFNLEQDPACSRATCAATAASSLSLHSNRTFNPVKENMHALRQEREELVAALDLCLLAIPEEVAGTDGNCDKKGDAENVQSTAVDCPNGQAAVGEAHEPSPELPDARHSTRIITQEEWRWLLCRLVNLLIETDHAIYTDAMMRSRMPYSFITPFQSPPSSPGKAPSIPHGVSSRSPTIDGRESPTILALKQAAPSKRATPLPSSKSVGEASNDARFNDFRKAEERMAFVNSLITWTIMRCILSQQLGQESPFGVSTSEFPPPQTARQTTYGVPVQWEEVIEELTNFLGGTQRKAAEVAIALWILRDATGHELVQCILQKPQCSFGSVLEGKPHGSLDAASTNKSPQGPSLFQYTVLLMESSDNTVSMDDILEEVEKVYEQNVLRTWAAYLEEQSSTSLFPKAEHQDLSSTPLDLFHCHTMATYAVCSPYWSEEKRQQFFRLIQKTWDEMNELALGTETGKEVHAVAAGVFGSQCTSVDAYGGNASAFSATGTATDAGDALLGEQRMVTHMSHCTPQRPTTGIDDEIRSFRSLSAQSINGGMSQTGLSIAEAQYTMLDDDFLLFMTQILSTVVLHLRVEQCLSTSPPRLEEAECCVNSEDELSITSCFFSCRQGARESLVKLRIATGNYPEALKSANAHFFNAKKKWSFGSNGRSCGLNYLTSMMLLVQAQEVSRMDTSIVETVQLALQQADLCEQAFVDSYPATGTYLVRYAAVRHGVYSARLFHLRAIWRAYYRMYDSINTSKYFNQYLEFVRHCRRSRRNEEMYAALKERGEQLEVEKEYGSAVLVFKQAVEYAKLTSQAAAAEAEAAATRKTKDVAMGSDVSVTEAADLEILILKERELKLFRCEAESERNLALAYILQAEHEVNVRCRRQQLSNAVNSAYAAQNVLQRCILKAKPPSSGTMFDVTSSLVVAAKALLRLGQPKKAALLLEPLIEDKVNSASVRPPLWSDALPDPTRPIPARELEERVQTLQLKFNVYEVHTQCLSKFDGARASRETTRAREFLDQVKNWASALFSNDQNSGNSSEGESQSMLFANRRLLTDISQEANALRPIITITCGDAWSMLGNWENALQEYSNALAMYADREGESNSNDISSTRSSFMEAGKERERNNCGLGESVVFSKLAEVYSALNKPKTAIHYNRQVLECASEVGDALLLYNARIRLARLYTATGDTWEAEEQWAKVSELAKEYEDQEISRETTRNIIAAQRAKGTYMDVLITAKELDTLASAAEGVDAAADKRFALEALADAHLQLGQYKECINALDELEKVQYKCSEWKGTLFRMRARALLGDGEVQEAIKVLMVWESEARQLRNWVEVGHANAVLAIAYATSHQVFKAKRNHEIVLSAFSEASSVSREDCNAALDSARWLVHNFYLNDEEVPLVEKAGRHSGSTPTHGTSPSGGNGRTGSVHDANEFQILTVSGDLNVLMREDEKRLRKSQELAHAGGGGGTDTVREEEDDNDICFNGGDDGEMLSSNSFRDGDAAAIPDNGPAPTTGSGSGGGKKLASARKDDPAVSFESTSKKTPPVTAASTTPPRWSSTSSVSKVLAGRRSLNLEGEIAALPEPVQWDALYGAQGLPPRPCTRVRTACFTRALEAIERAAQLSLMPLVMRQRLVPRNPADAVDLALLAFPRCTFVFYFAEFATQYVAIVRPAGRSFFLRRLVQAYSLKEFYNKRHVSQPSTRETASSALAESLSHAPVERREKRLSVIASSIGSLTRRSRAGSVDRSPVLPGPIAGHAAMNEELQQGLQDLYADLWTPVRDSLRMARCFNDEAECFAFILDPALLHVPFPSLYESGANCEPLGQQLTMVMAPSVAKFLGGMQHEEQPSFFNAPSKDLCVFLPEKTSNASAANSMSLVNIAADKVAGKQSLTTALSSTTASLEDTNLFPTPVLQGPAKWLFGNLHSWSVFTGCTRKEIISAFALPSCRALIVLCDPVKHMFKVADGMVRLEDLTRGHSCLSESLSLVVVTNDASTATSVEEPGVAARLCLEHGCRRVLRMDLLPGTSITADHHRLVQIYLEKLLLAFEWRMRYPYALALRMAQEEALRCHFPPVVWASLTLLGAP